MLCVVLLQQKTGYVYVHCVYREERARYVRWTSIMAGGVCIVRECGHLCDFSQSVLLVR